MSIVEALDLGHGGSSDGAIAILEGKLYREADSVLEIGLAVRRKRPSVYLVRDLDETLTFRQRQNRFLEASADIIVSLHLDSTPWAQDSRGTHGYHNIGNPITRGMARHAVDRAPPPLKGGNVIQAFDIQIRQRSKPAILQAIEITNQIGSPIATTNHAYS